MPKESLSLFARALLALALGAGFYVMALALGAFLLLAPWLEWHYAHTLTVKILILPILGGIILYSIYPREIEFEAPGLPLLPDSQPRLFGLIAEVARECGHPVPEEIYLCQDVNAFVSQRGGWFGAGSTAYMGLGLPLLAVLNRGELRSVLAHEFGHYVGGDTRLGPFIVRTRMAIARTVRNLEGERGEATLAQLPFTLYGKFFLRVTRAVSRSQELAADRLAASLEGAKTAMAALKKVERASLAFGGYWNQELLPLLEKGYLPPFLEGFERFLASPKVEGKLKEALSEVLKAKVQPGAYDSHPPLVERLEALEKGAPGKESGGETPAMALLEGAERMGQEVLASMVREGHRERLKPLAWSQAGEVAFVPFWRGEVYGLMGKMPKRVLASLLLDDAALREAGLARLQMQEPTAKAEDPRCLLAGAYVYEADLLLKLKESGWTLSCEPGQDIELTRDDQKIAPFGLLMGARETQLKKLQTAKFLEKAGVAALVLGGN